MGSTVFFIMVSLPAVTAPSVARALALMPMACCICCPVEVQHACSNDGRDERGQRGMMPAALANARECRFAEPHLEFVAEHQADDQFAAVAAGALAAGHRRRKDVRRMRRVLLPVNVVVVHAADHQRVGQRRRDRIHLLARADDGRLARARRSRRALRAR